MSEPEFKSTPQRVESFWDTFPIVCFWVVYLLILTLHPFEFHREASGRLSLFLASFFHPLDDGARQLGSRDFVLNFIFFVPCGFLFHTFAKKLRKRSLSTIALAAVMGGALSFLVELTQVFVPARSPLARDVFANATGALCGALISYFRPVRMDGVLWEISTSKLALAPICLLAAWPMIMWSGNYPWFHLSNWNPQFKLQVGSKEPAWRGRIYSVAIYSEALSQDDIRALYALGYSRPVFSQSFASPPIVYYAFSEGRGNIVHDFSGQRQPLHLHFQEGSEFSWLNAGGVELRGSTLLASGAPPQKLLDGVQVSNELSVELWFSPSRRTECPQVNLVSLSKQKRANFAIDQVGSRLSFRLRTPITGSDGGQGNLRIEGKIPDADVVQAVATYRNGFERLFLNGIASTQALDLTSTTAIAVAAKDSLSAQVAYSFYYFFPAAFFVAGASKARHRSSLIKIPYGITVGSLFAAPEVLRVALLGRHPDWSLVVSGLAVQGLCVLFGALCVAKLRGSDAVEKSESKRKVAILHQGFIPLYRVRFYEMLNQIGGVEYVVFHGLPPKNSGHREFTGTLSFPNVRIRNFSFCFSGRTVTYQTAVRRVLFGPYAAVVLGHELAFISNLLLFFLCRLSGKPVLWWGHGFEKKREGQLALLSSAVATIKSWLARHSDKYIVYTETGAQSLARTCVPRENVTVVRNTIDMEQERLLSAELGEDDVSEARKENGLKRDSLVILYIGRVYREKRVQEVLSLVEEINSRKLCSPFVEAVIAGAGPDLDRLVGLGRTIEGVHFLGEVHDQARIAKLMRVASVVVIPGKVGLAVNHAFAHGVPVITRQHSFHAPEVEYLEHGKNGLIVDGDFNDLVQATANFLNSSDIQRKFAEGARMSSQRLTLDFMVTAFDGAVLEVLSRRSGSTSDARRPSPGPHQAQNAPQNQESDLGLRH